MTDIELISTDDLCTELAKRCEAFAAVMVKLTSESDAEFWTYHAGPVNMLFDGQIHMNKALCERLDKFAEGN